jgi:glycine cleavage system transcriptional repressor
MAVFCGEFAVIILLSGSEASLAAILHACREIESETGLSISLKQAVEKKAADFFHPYKLTASCMDHPGIVYQISGALSGFGVNIESMETMTYFAPESGTPLFQLAATLAVPVQTNINMLRDRFAEIQRNENIDIEISSIQWTRPKHS